MTEDHRRPRAFILENNKPVRHDGAPAKSAKIVFDEDTNFPIATAPRTAGKLTQRTYNWLPWLVGSLAALLIMWIGLQTWSMIRQFFEQSIWLGWAATSIAAVAVLSLTAIMAREVLGFVRLRKLQTLHDNAARAINLDDKTAAAVTINELTLLYSDRPELATPMATFRRQLQSIMNPSDQVRLADRHLLTPLDAEGRMIITNRVRRVALLTAVVPAAAIDVVLVAAQNFSMLREIASIYGGRPSTLATIRLARMVLAHLAVAGGLALSDTLIQNIIGKGLLGRISARFGEGALNGILTARIGVAAIEVCRPVSKAVEGRRELVSIVRSALAFRSDTGDTNEN